MFCNFFFIGVVLKRQRQQHVGPLSAGFTSIQLNSATSESFKTILRLQFWLVSLSVVLGPAFAFSPISPMSPISMALDAVCTKRIHFFVRKIVFRDRVKLNRAVESMTHQALIPYMTLFYKKANQKNRFIPCEHNLFERNAEMNKSLCHFTFYSKKH